MKISLRWTWMVFFCIGLPIKAQQILISDSLRGVTSGTIRGGTGEFVEGGGWRSQGGYIVFDAGKVITNGFFEAKMRGWTAPATGAERSHVLNGWEIKDAYNRVDQTGSYFNWRMGSRYGTTERPYPLEVLTRADTLSDRVEGPVGVKSVINDGNPHTYRTEWSNGTVSFFIDGVRYQSWTFNRFALRYFTIGRDAWYGITDPAPIISDVFVGCEEDEPTNDWIRHEPFNYPSGRQYHAMAYIGEDQVLLFGGQSSVLNSETWIFDIGNGNWVKKSPANKPSDRRNHAMAYIGGDKVLLFGGFGDSLLSDTWTYDASSGFWAKKNPSTSPAQREYHAMAYIGGDKVLLFGGDTGISSQVNDTWIYDLGADKWTPMDPPVKPSIREGHAMAYIGGDRVLLFGGNSNGKMQKDTWMYDLSQNEWVPFTSSPYTPPARAYLDAAYMGNECVFIYGGWSTYYHDESAVFDLKTGIWKETGTDLHPSSRTGHKIAETSLDGSRDLVMFGGEHKGTLYNETWFYLLQQPVENTPPRVTSASTAHAVEDELFLYTARATDPEGTKPVFTFKNYPVWMTPADSVISGTPLDGHGNTSFWVVASDGILKDSLKVTVTVTPVNDAPVITSPLQATAHAGTRFSYQARATDVDNALLQFSFKKYPKWMQPQGTFIVGTPGYGAADTTFVISVTDGDKTTEAVVSVAVVTTNTKPVIYGIQEVTFRNNQIHTIALDTCVSDLTDPVESMSWQVSAASPHLILQLMAHNLSIAAPGWSGQTEMTLIVSDPHGASDTLDVPVNVLLPSGVDDEEIRISEFALHPNYPNPFNPATTLVYDIPEACPVSIEVYNLRGECIARLVDRHEEAGSHRVQWNGTNSEGLKMPSGLYLVRMKAGSFSVSRKISLIQ